MDLLIKFYHLRKLLLPDIGWMKRCVPVWDTVFRPYKRGPWTIVIYRTLPGSGFSTHTSRFIDEIQEMPECDTKRFPGI